jgi:hypothetical protein
VKGSIDWNPSVFQNEENLCCQHRNPRRRILLRSTIDRSRRWALRTDLHQVNEDRMLHGMDTYPYPEPYMLFKSEIKNL